MKRRQRNISALLEQTQYEIDHLPREQQPRDDKRRLEQYIEADDDKRRHSTSIPER